LIILESELQRAVTACFWNGVAVRDIIEAAWPAAPSAIAARGAPVPFWFG